METPAGRNQRGGTIIQDQCGTPEFCRRQAGTRINGGIAPSASEVDPAEGGFSRAPGWVTFRSQFRCLNREPGTHANGNNLDGALQIRVTVDALMFAMKWRRGNGGVPGHRQLITLARITNIGGADQMTAWQIFFRAALQAQKFALPIGSVQYARRVIAHAVCEKHTERRKSARVLGNQYHPNAQLPRDFA